MIINLRGRVTQRPAAIEAASITFFLKQDEFS
jgi:hypothetical protein